MKVEFQHHYKARHGHTLRDRLVAHLPRYAALASRLAPLMNLRNRAGWLAKLAESITGFSARRKLPAFRRDVFTRDCAAAPEPRAGSRQVVLFADTFNNHFEPDILRDAQRVLAAAGYEVVVVQGQDRPLCCGRTYLGTGMVEQARAEARRTLDALLPWARAGVAIVGLEPSCIFSFRDEYLVLGLGAEAQELAAATLLFEEFVVREQAAGRFNARFRPLAQPVLLHTHCHQKAFGAVSAVQQALALVPALTGAACGVELLRHGRQLRHGGRARGRLAGDGRTHAAAGRARRRSGCADRGRRHQLPPPDPRRRAARRAARGAGAGARAGMTDRKPARNGRRAARCQSLQLHPQEGSALGASLRPASTSATAVNGSLWRVITTRMPRSCILRTKPVPALSVTMASTPSSGCGPPAKA
jgi:hypothetical protein